ncbi:carboxypeptidase-like regulatory domain-containing protein [Lutibacter sp. A80]|uniref:carboxypeptidase-like regulatory domain-containing protein n=1 Tax=Lutibacter sp. A80 TaxID=2918453 RepID=UPI001F06C6B7|nr:carboxypeptidase-like regulatory domain-containing protein [Lutibacter sp. A80]UMB60237.1 carboxypeptidase-like regulatory domain-containing protein [Lutibacter sp. A80]
MRNKNILLKKIFNRVFTFIFIAVIGFQNTSYSNNLIVNDSILFKQFKGKVIDSKTKKPLIFATLLVNNTNISSITNTQGEFQLKIPTIYSTNKVTVSFLGYTSKIIDFNNLNEDKIVIKLDTHIEELSEIKINIEDADSLIREMLKNRENNYLDFPTSMTAFYRETIKKRRSYVSLSEAVIEINKQSYIKSKNDLIKLYKARKSTDYNKLDTITMKLKGGPSSSLKIDVMKNTFAFFGATVFDRYDFKFDTSTKINNRPVYVVNFKQKKHIKDPFYYGKLYIDANTYALISTKFHLNLDDKQKASRLFVVKKPNKATVIPTEVTYHINYRTKNGKWHFGYSRIELGFKIDYDKRLFNSVYNIIMETAVTNWKKITDNTIKYKERLKPSVILSDEAQGFSDPEFWGEFNVIEPEKPIENAIKKIQKQLEKNNRD